MKCLNLKPLVLTLLCLLTLFNGISQAAMEAVGPVNPILTLPTWYMDVNGLPLEPCVDQNFFCILPPPFDPLLPDPAFPILEPVTTTGPINDTNFPGEAFYYSAFVNVFDIERDPAIPTKGDRIVFGYVLEFAFLSGVVPETGITFLRTDLQKMDNLTPNSTYRLTHPHGVFEFQTDGAGTTIDAGPGTRFEDQPGSIANYLPPLFKAAPNTNIGPFLTPIGGSANFIRDLASGNLYIGDPAVPVPVVGSPSGNNFVRIERLDGAGVPVPGAVWQSDLFLLMGKVFEGQIPSPMAIDRATYASDGANGQVDVFVTALPGAPTNITISGTGIASTALTQDVPNSGKFFAHVPFVGPLPSGVIITNSLDAPLIDYPVMPVDEVNISQAIYNPTTKSLTINAASRDTVLPPVSLTAPAFAVAGAVDSPGTLAINLSATIPPQNIQVISSQGGSATLKVRVDDGSAVTSGVTR